jgi:hypothetical protein
MFTSIFNEKTEARGVSLPADAWRHLRARAKSSDVPMSRLILRAVERYVLEEAGSGSKQSAREAPTGDE